ncbi:hypothetical protein VCRLGP8_1290044 [Vibrio crassostreae]|nr:hypothetical protein VCRLGP8_1290044 [Vibrio crassostreae]CDT25989.1 hypothetical protein VCRLGP107_360043 [Vibrio crassostreae]CDT70688.1 hypothetical protein VCRLGP7_990044 [Vibrio crassostreae]
MVTLPFDAGWLFWDRRATHHNYGHKNKRRDFEKLAHICSQLVQIYLKNASTIALNSRSQENKSRLLFK